MTLTDVHSVMRSIKLLLASHPLQENLIHSGLSTHIATKAFNGSLLERLCLLYRCIFVGEETKRGGLLFHRHQSLYLSPTENRHIGGIILTQDGMRKRLDEGINLKTDPGVYFKSLKQSALTGPLENGPSKRPRLLLIGKIHGNNVGFSLSHHAHASDESRIQQRLQVL